MTKNAIIDTRGLLFSIKTKRQYIPPLNLGTVPIIIQESLYGCRVKYTNKSQGDTLANYYPSKLGLSIGLKPSQVLAIMAPKRAFIDRNTDWILTDPMGRWIGDFFVERPATNLCFAKQTLKAGHLLNTSRKIATALFYLSILGIILSRSLLLAATIWLFQEMMKNMK